MFGVLHRSVMRTAVRHYSDLPPLYKLQEKYADIENLFAKHKLHELKSSEEIDKFVLNGTITEHIANELKHDLKVQQEAGKTAQYWKKIFWIIGVPLIGLSGYNAFVRETEHMEHLEHTTINDVPYEYLKIRAKKYPWGDGDKTLFHNDKYNR